MYITNVFPTNTHNIIAIVVLGLVLRPIPSFSILHAENWERLECNINICNICRLPYIHLNCVSIIYLHSHGTWRMSLV